MDPGGKTIQIGFELFQDRLTTIGANVQRLQRQADLAVMFPDLRARVVANPVTGEAYLLLDIPSNPPPPIPLGFTPNRPYVASMPSPLAEARDRLPAVLERAEMTLRTVGEIVARMPDSLDRSDRFFTNVERIIRESQLPQLSADSRAFFTATTAQMTQIATEIDRVMGPEGTLVKLAEEARTAMADADVPRSTQSVRDALDRTSMAADDFRRALPEIREALEQVRELARRMEEQPESVVYGPRKPRPKDKDPKDKEGSMTRHRCSTIVLLLTLAGTGGAACQLKRPDVIPARMIEPRLIDPGDPGSQPPSPSQRAAEDAIPLRLAVTQARGHIGRRLLHQEADGELVEDAVWRWSSAPARYLDSALRLAFSSSPHVRLVDSGNAPAIAVTLIAWHLEAGAGVHLIGAIELVITRTDRTVSTQVIRGSEPVSSQPPGDLAAAAGRLLQTLASQSVTRAAQETGG